MERRSFLKGLGIFTTAIVTPSLVTAVKSKSLDESILSTIDSRGFLVFSYEFQYADKKIVRITSKTFNSKSNRLMNCEDTWKLIKQIKPEAKLVDVMYEINDKEIWLLGAKEEIDSLNSKFYKEYSISKNL